MPPPYFDSPPKTRFNASSRGKPDSMSNSAAKAGDALARRNAILLAAAMALAGGNATVVFSTGALVGNGLAASPALATLPVSIFVVGIAAMTYPAAILMRRLGRRVSFMIGTLFGALMGIGAAAGVYFSSLALFCAATFCAGCYQAFANAYRFAAADTATPDFRPKAISWVLTGGMFAAILGPQMVIWTKDWLNPYLFMASYLCQAAIAIVALFVVSRFIDAPAPTEVSGPTRPLREIIRQPRFLVAVACGTASQGLMNMVMTSAPLAMVMCDHTITNAQLGIQWHVLAMYAPSFFTGGWITRFGKERVTALGMAILIGCAIVNLNGISLGHFWVALILLGIGWNLGFIGATAIVTDCHQASERNKVQGLNDTLIFGTTAIGSFASGQILASFGWNAVNWVVVPIALACIAAVLMAKPRPAAA